MAIPNAHPRDKEIFKYLPDGETSVFEQRFVERLLRVADTCGLEEAVRYRGSNPNLFGCDKRSLASDSPKSQCAIGKLTEGLTASPKEDLRTFFKYFFDKLPGENTDFIPNGEKISHVMETCFYNRWFVPTVHPEELQPLLNEIAQRFPALKVKASSLEARATTVLDEATDARYPGIENKDICFDILLYRDRERIEKAANQSDLLRRGNPIRKSIFIRARDYVAGKVAPLTSFAEHARRLIKEAEDNRLWPRQNIASSVAGFCEGLIAFSLKEYMKQERGRIEKGITGDLVYAGRDMYTEHYSLIVSRDNAEELSEYIRFLVLEDLVPSESRSCLPECLFRVSTQGYWLSGFSKLERGSRKAVLWHL